jgi:hypothetical protein
MDDTNYGSEYSLDSFPLKYSAPDPMFIYPSSRGTNVIEAFPITVEAALEICEMYGWKWSNPDGKAMDDEVIWLEYWSPEARCFMIDEVAVLPVQENIYKMLPYIHAYSGYGVPSSNPATLSRSILYSKRDMISMYTAALSQMYAINSRFAWPKRTFEGTPEQLEEYQKVYGTLDFNPETVTLLPEGTKIDTVNGESPPSGFYSHLAMLQKKAAPPMVLSTDAPDYASGYFANVMASSGKAVYKDPFKALEVSLEKVLALSGRMVENVLKKKVGIKTMTAVGDGQTIHYEAYVKPDDFKGYYDCKVSLFADTPEANAMKKKLGVELQSTGVISHRANLIEYQGKTAEEAEMEMSQIWAERALANNPSLQQAIGENALERLGIAKEAETLESTVKAPGYLPEIKGVTGAEQVFPREILAEEESGEAIQR